MKIYLFALLMIITQQTIAQKPDGLKIWFNQPAANWNEALPIGNGKLGAMIFGGVASERMQLNEETVWTGMVTDFVNPQAKSALPQVRKLLFAGKYAEAQQLAQQKMMGDKKVGSNYQTLGDLFIDFQHSVGEITQYERSLDLETAVAAVQYRVRNITFKRQLFSTAPGEAIVLRLSADKDTSINVGLHLSRPGDKAKIEVAGNDFLMTEHVGDGIGVKMAARIKVINEGGTSFVANNIIHIAKATSVTIYITAATNYRGDDEVELTLKRLSTVAGRSFADLLKEHIADYQQYFKRVDLDLGSTDAVYFPTDNRLAAMQRGNVDPHLIKLYYQFGRYLLISSSRPGSLPANLQGIWADGLYPPWSADYHININIQMNYWPAEITNLSEMHMPFLKFIGNLVPDGQKTAKEMYGIHGAVAHFTTDPWHFTETYGETQWAMWPMGLAWCCQHFWEHYLFTNDKHYLDTLAYPVMKEAAIFCANYLVENPMSKHLVSGPSISPENTFKTKDGKIATMVMGPTMDHMIIRDLLTNTIAASVVLNKDVALRKRLQQILIRLAPTRVGADGRIMEWTEAFEEPEPGHRHISHLFGLYPGKQVTSQTPELLAAARKTIDHRLANGGGHTGWSRAWIINYFARLNDGETAYQNLLALLTKSTLPNLFDNHPPFQIDGNFGATAGITEMLLQSHAEALQVLPALPKAWPTGYIHGIVGRGGFEVDIDWQNSRLKRLKVLSKHGKHCTIKYMDKEIQLETLKGKSYLFDENLEQL